MKTPDHIKNSEANQSVAEKPFNNIEKKDQINKQNSLLLMQQMSAGPLPVSKEFDGYEKVLPGSANRILVMAEKEQDNRLTITQQTIQLQHKQLDNTKIIENKRAWGDFFHKSSPAIAIIGIVTIAIFSKGEITPYIILLIVMAFPEAKPFIEKFFKK